MPIKNCTGNCGRLSLVNREDDTGLVFQGFLSKTKAVHKRHVSRHQCLKKGFRQSICVLLRHEKDFFPFRRVLQQNLARFDDMQELP